MQNIFDCVTSLLAFLIVVYVFKSGTNSLFIC